MPCLFVVFLFGAFRIQLVLALCDLNSMLHFVGSVKYRPCMSLVGRQNLKEV